MGKLAVVGIQMGPYPGNCSANMEKAVETLGDWLRERRPELYREPARRQI